jgi:hypothetical protein
VYFGHAGGLPGGHPPEPRLPRNKSIHLLVLMGILGLVMGLFLFGSAFGPVLGLITGLATGLFLVVYFGLSEGLLRSQPPERLPSPNESIWRAGRDGLVLGLVIGLLTGLTRGPVEGVNSGLIIWMVLGLSFVNHFLLRLFLTWRGNLPWDLVTFLDGAAERLLLRKVGGSYTFVHGLLREYLATSDEPPSSTESTSSDGEGKDGTDC